MASRRGGGGGGTTVYVEEDFTLTTTGDLSGNNLAVDELGGGWVGSASDFAYDASGGGVSVAAGTIRVTWVQTDGREDVQVTGATVLVRGSSEIVGLAGDSGELAQAHLLGWYSSFMVPQPARIWCLLTALSTLL